jgi:protease IV
MLQFLKFVFATIVGLLLFFFIGFLIVIGIAAASGSKNEVEVKEKSVLKIAFDQPLTERSNANPLAGFPGLSSNSPSSLGIIDIRTALKNAAIDDKIKGVYLEAGVSNAGWASLEEVREALLEFKKSKKFIIAYGNFIGEKDFYVASVADRIFLNPAGQMEFNGYAANYTFLKGMFEKLEIKPEIFRVGEYKSAVEPFFLDKMSDASKEQTLSYLTSIQNHNWEQIAQARNLTRDQLNSVANELVIPTPKQALAAKMITDIGYEDEVLAVLRKNLDIKAEKDKINFVSVGQYLKGERKIKEPDSKDKVAVIIASGDIGGEKSDENQTIGDDFVKTIRKARLDDKIKAVVIRINSPGGSSFTSDIIWREILLTKKVKPVIASMSDVAASGGYYLAMACDTIVAHPNTITGSIGIFGLTFNVEPLLKNKFGITIDGVETNPHASIGQRPLDDFERNLIQKSVERGYDEFTGKVAEGRKTTQDAIKKVASGRVWSGAEAKERGLVDVFGNLEDAIALAAKLAKLKEKEYKVRYYPEKKSEPFAEIIAQIMSDKEDEAMAKQLGVLAPYLKQIKNIQSYQGLQMRMPTVEVK